MSTRVVKLKLMTQQALVAIETGVRTFEEFKALPEVQALNLQWDQIALIDRATRNTISLDGALLPNIDCLLFVQPTKTKSGAASRSELYEIIKQMKANGIEVPFNMTQMRTSFLEEFIEDNEVKVVESHYKESISTPTQEEVFFQIVDAENGLVVLRQVETLDGGDVIPVNELADYITNDELDAEQAEIASQLN